MKRLYGTSDPAEAEAIVALLRGRGIEPSLDRGEGSGPISIDIRDEDAAAAAEALAGHFERQDPRASDLPEEGDGSPPGFWQSLLGALGWKKKEPAP